MSLTFLTSWCKRCFGMIPVSTRIAQELKEIEQEQYSLLKESTWINHRLLYLAQRIDDIRVI